MNLSDRQMNILRYIAEFVEERSYPPTIRQIGAACDISSTSVVKYNLNKLETDGLILRDPEVSRGLSLHWDKLEEAGLLAEIRRPVGHAVNGVAERLKQTGEKVVNFFSVPVLGHIAAGEPIQVDVSEYDSADEWIDLNEALYRDREKLFALRVQGDSMVDASVLDGDIVILRHQEKAENGEMVAAWIDGVGETTLKRFYLEGKQVRLRAANPNYQDMFFPAAQVSVKGRVVSVIRQLE
ncbi:MAG: transcriptional repressor LexA [Caldilineaceae bacterium]|nr:transcriptional repressor LexA [Caldilineaceae bacterium]